MITLEPAACSKIRGEILVSPYYSWPGKKGSTGNTEKKQGGKKGEKK